MLLRLFVNLLALSMFVLAQSPSPTPSFTVITSTIIATSITLGPNRQESTVTRTTVFTTTQPIAPPPTSVNTNTTQSSNSTASGGIPSGNSTTSTKTTLLNLPTAPTVSGGGGPGGAPLPGDKGSHGAYGPDDGYIAAAASLKRNAILVGMNGLLVGGALILL